MNQDVDTVFIRQRKSIDVTFEEIDSKVYLCIDEMYQSFTCATPEQSPWNIQLMELPIISICWLSACVSFIWIGIIKIDTSIIEGKSVFNISEFLFKLQLSMGILTFPIRPLHNLKILQLS